MLCKRQERKHAVSLEIGCRSKMEGHRKTLAAKNDDEQRGGGRNSREKEHDCVRVAQRKPHCRECSTGLSDYAALRNETNSIDFVNGAPAMRMQLLSSQIYIQK